MRRRNTRPGNRFLKVAALVAVAGLVAVAAAGAGGKAHKATTLNAFMFTAFKPGWDALTKNYMKAHPDVEIKTTYFVASLDYGTSLITQLASGGGPDIFYSTVGSFQSHSNLPLAAAGKIVPMQGPWLKRWDKRLLARTIYKGKVYSLPMDTSYVGIWYNKQVLAKYGLHQAKTFSDLLSQCKAAVAKGTTLFYQTFQPAYNFAVEMSLAASNVLNTDPNWFVSAQAKKTSFQTSAGWRRVFQHILDMKDAGCFQPHPEQSSGPEAWSALALGKAAASIYTFGMPVSIHQLVPTFDVNNLTLSPFPGDTVAATRQAMGATNSIVINSKSKNLAVDRDFINFLARQGQSQLWAKAANTISPRDFKLGILPSLVSSIKPYVTSGKTVNQLPAIITNGDTTTAIIIGTTGLFTGQKTIAQILADADAALAKGPPS